MTAERGELKETLDVKLRMNQVRATVEEIGLLARNSISRTCTHIIKLRKKLVREA